MAIVLKTFDWSQVSRNSASPRTRQYPWDQWFDGRIWRLAPEKDFDGPAVSLERVIRTTANRKRIKVRVRIIEGDFVVIQAHQGAPDRGITHSLSKAEMEAAAAAAVNGNGAKPRRKLVRS